MAKDTLKVAIDNLLNKPNKLTSDTLIREFLECVIDWADCRVRVDASLDASDIEIGAVEVKDYDSDTRLEINGDNEALVHDQDTHDLLTTLISAVSGSTRTTTTFFALAALPAVSTTGSSIDVSTRNQVNLYVDYTKGAESGAELIVELSPDGILWAERAGDNLTGSSPTIVTQSTLVHKFSASGKYIIPVPVNDMNMRVKIVATAGPAPTGTIDVEGVLG